MYRVPGFLSRRPNWLCCSSPPLSPRGETHPLAGEGGWGTLFRRRVFYVYCNPTCGRDICCSSSEWGSYDTVVIFGLRNWSFIRIITNKTWRGEGREERDVTTLSFCVCWRSSGQWPQLHDPLGDAWCPLCMYYFSMRSQKTLDKTISSSVIYLQYSSLPYSLSLHEKFIKKLMLQAAF